MIGGLWNGLSGISTFERALSAESNNVTNVNTVGHKADQVRFEDLMYQNGYGSGVQVESISKTFVQGNIRPSNNDFDVAIEGKGYFMVTERESGNTFYTRAGNFQMGIDGVLQTPDSLKVLGLTPQESSVISSDPAITQISNVHTNFIATVSIQNNDFVKTINARTSDFNKSAQASGVSGDGFKSSSAKIADIEALIVDYREKLDLYRTTSTALPVESTKQITTLDFSSYLNELNDENDFIKVTINNREIIQKFDTDIATTMNKFADKISNIEGLKGTVDTTIGKVTLESLIPGKEVAVYDIAVNDKAAFLTNVQNASVGSGIGVVNSSRNALKEALELADAKFIDITNTISLANQENLAVNEIQLKLENLNLSENTFGIVEIDNEGMVFLKDNDNKFIVGKVQTAFFTNDQGLDAQGNNLYRDTEDSGVAKYAGHLNKVIGNSLEESNINTSDALTNILVYQKAFEANSKSITTSDELLKTAINLRK